MTVTFQMKFYSAIIPHSHRFQNCFFHICIQTHSQSLQDFLWGRTAEGTQHYKCRVCSPLWSWGKQQPGRSGNFVPCWGLCISASAMGTMGVVKKICCFLLQRTHTPRQTCFHAKMSLAKLDCNRSSSAAARGTVKPAHQRHAFCSCRSLYSALAWRTPCPMLHTDKVLLLLHSKRNGSCKSHVETPHLICYHGNRWKHQDLPCKPRTKDAGRKQVCYWYKLRITSSIIFIFSAREILNMCIEGILLLNLYNADWAVLLKCM